MSYCVVILRTPPYWLLKVGSCNFKLKGKFISLPITHSKRYDVQTSASQNISTRKTPARVAADDQKRSWLSGVRQRKRFRLYENCLLRSSLYQYINSQQPMANENYLFRRRPRKPTSSDTVGKNVQNGFKHDMFWSPNN